jgi:hypothetical protein
MKYPPHKEMTDMVDAAEDSAHAAEKKEHDVVVHVNEQPVTLEHRKDTGLAIKTAAIEQGVQIEEDFILVEELKHGRTRVIGDEDLVEVTPHSRFTANSGDDNA